MNLNELSSPIRIYWDLSPVSLDSSLDYLKICEEILELKVLKLDIWNAGFFLSAECFNILKRLKSENIKISLTISSLILSPSILKLFSRLKVSELFLEIGSKGLLKTLIQKIAYCNTGDLPLGVSFPLTNENYRDIPDILSLCESMDIGNLIFPIQRLIKNRNCFYIGKRDRETLASRLSEINYENIKLIIHDPFLWRVFYSKEKYSEVGCQAANTIIYISPDGGVYPCPSMPAKLGDLSEANLKEIISTDKKRDLRKRLVNPPEGCLSCYELKMCNGGCRGRAYVLNNSLDDPDPACMF
jgi:GeoRSP system SPASM domain protein